MSRRRYSHEIRTPMAGIIGLLELVQQNSSLPLEVHQDLSTMLTCANTMLHLLNDLLDVRKIEQGKLRLDHAPFDAQECVETCVALFSCTLQRKGVQIGVDYGPEATRVLVGDGGRLKQVVSNLLSNASKFTASGYVAVRVWGVWNETGSGVRQGGGGGFHDWEGSLK